MPADFAPVLLAIEEVCLGAGAIRIVTTASRPRAYTADPTQEAVRALEKPGFEVSIEDRVHPKMAWSQISTLSAADIGILIRIEYPVPFELQDADRRLCRASAWTFEEQLRRALMAPGNLTRTLALAATGIRGGCLDRYTGAKLEREDFSKRRLSILTRFRCFVDAT